MIDIYHSPFWLAAGDPLISDVICNGAIINQRVAKMSDCHCSNSIKHREDTYFKWETIETRTHSEPLFITYMERLRNWTILKKNQTTHSVLHYLYQCNICNKCVKNVSSLAVSYGNIVILWFVYPYAVYFTLIGPPVIIFSVIFVLLCFFPVLLCCLPYENYIEFY